MKQLAQFVLMFVVVVNAEAARYTGSVIQPNTVPPGSCCSNTGLIKFEGVGAVLDEIVPTDWLWSFDLDFDPTQGITIHSMTISSLSNDYFPGQPNLSFSGLFQFEYVGGLQPLSPTATPNVFVTGQITPELLRVQGTWDNFGVQTEIDSVITAGIGNSQSFAVDFSNFPESIGVTCNGANACNNAAFAAPANVFAVPSIAFPPYYTLGQVRSYMSETATLLRVPEPSSISFAAIALAFCCCRRTRNKKSHWGLISVAQQFGYPSNRRSRHTVCI
jgi:hypothetical protein